MTIAKPNMVIELPSFISEIKVNFDIHSRITRLCSSMAVFARRLGVPPIALYVALAGVILLCSLLKWKSASTKAIQIVEPEPPKVSTFFDFGEAILGATAEAAAATLSKTLDASGLAGTSTAKPSTSNASDGSDGSDGGDGGDARDASDASDASDGRDASDASDASDALPEEPAALPSPQAPVEEATDETPFIAATKFEGRKRNFVYKNGPAGPGYYNRDYEWVDP